MQIKATVKEGVKIEDALQLLTDIIEKEIEIRSDPHTNKCYDLINGKMWHRGDGVGKSWELFCNSREGQRDAKEIINIF